ncbi:hypothetical protein ABZ307_39835 [Streptomyces griseorubiginosus]|uniref:hypothetical protein n=1 Tax=Streptomyces griseorubiginosus TaxID=67304 RepID=UPI0033AD16F8
MKSRTVLAAVTLAVMPLLLASPAQAATPETAHQGADIPDLDAGLIAFAAQILSTDGAKGIIGIPGTLLASAPR